MKVTIETIPHDKQRYNTVGDYYLDLMGNLCIYVSDMKNEKYELLVAIHELAEYYLCKDRGITEKSITEFDIDFEKKRLESNIDEPGDDPNAPYVNEHCIATAIERLMCASLNVKWDDYSKAVLALS